MTAKISDTMINMIGAQSTRWPTADVGEVWQQLHDAISEVRMWVRVADNDITGVDTNRELSDLGKLKKISESGIVWIKQLRAGSEVKKAEAAVARELEKIAKGSTLPAAPETVADVAIAAEIRAFIARQEHPWQSAMNLAGDPRVVAAVASAPSFLSGMSNEQKNLFVDRAKTALFPDGTGERQQLEAALKVLQDAVGAAERKIAERARLHRTPTGWQVPPAVQKAA